MDLPWQDQLCCDSPSARLAAEGEDTHVPERNSSASDLPHPHPRCSYSKSTAKSHPEEFSGGTSFSTHVCHDKEVIDSGPAVYDVKWKNDSISHLVLVIMCR